MMTRYRTGVFYLLMAVLIFGHLFDTALRREHWPFSSYAMFSGITPTQYSIYEIFCLTDQNGIKKEVPLNPDWVPNLPAYKLQTTIRRYVDGSPPDPKRLHEMLSDFLYIYDARRKASRHEGPPLVGLRLYKVELPMSLAATSLAMDHTSSDFVRHMALEVDEKLP